MTTEKFLAGLEVEVDPTEIERELASLWKPASEKEGGEGAVVRACLANVVAFLADAREWQGAVDVFSEVSRRHPNRTIYLVVDSNGADTGSTSSSRLRASVTANCYAPARGVAPVCCEQITLRARPDDVRHFSGALAPVLVPDVPVFLWWPGDHAHPLLPELGSHVDRVIVNTRRDLFGSATLGAIDDLVRERRIREVVDLGWRGLERWRQAIAELFDEPALRALVPRLSRIEAEWAKAPAGDACPVEESALLAGWLVSRLGLELESRAATDHGVDLTYRNGAGAEVAVCLREHDSDAFGDLLPGEPVSVRFAADPLRSHVCVALDPAAPRTARLSYRTERLCSLPRVLPFARPAASELLGGILNTPTHPRVFRQALEEAVRIVAVST